MKASSAKAKGRQAEHAVIAALQEWWRGVEPSAVFFRTPRSGGWSNAAATGMKTMGDLCYDPTTCKLWPFSVEVKHQKVVTHGAIERFVNMKASSLDKFWLQCIRAAEKDHLKPLLVYRGDRMPFRVAWFDRGFRNTALLDVFLQMNDPKMFLSSVG